MNINISYTNHVLKSDLLGLYKARKNLHDKYGGYEEELEDRKIVLESLIIKHVYANDSLRITLPDGDNLLLYTITNKGYSEIDIIIDLLDGEVQLSNGGGNEIKSIKEALGKYLDQLSIGSRMKKDEKAIEAYELAIFSNDVVCETLTSTHTFDDFLVQIDPINKTIEFLETGLPIY